MKKEDSMNTYKYLDDKINYYFQNKDTPAGEGIYDRLMDDIEDAHIDGDITETEYYLLLERL
jgi:hypothetical protein